jgi:nitroreductase
MQDAIEHRGSENVRRRGSPTRTVESMDKMTVFEAIDNLRAAWRFRPEPIDDSDLRRVLEAATRAASGGNSQPWRFVVVRDPELRRQLGEIYLRAWNVYRAAVERLFGAQIDEQGRSMLRGAESLARNFGAVPVHIIVSLKKTGGRLLLRDDAGKPIDIGTPYSSVYPAVQNLILAATALGLGTRLITLHRIFEDEVKALLGIADDVETVALIPLGRPVGVFKRRPRLPLDAVVKWK